MKTSKNRIVWSPDCGGCMMEQKMVNGAWVDNNSMEEGSYPVNDKYTKVIVKWYNLNLRKNQAMNRAWLLQQKYLSALQQAAKIEAQKTELMKKYRNGTSKK